MAAPSLEPISDEYLEQGLQSVFLYTREAHPGERYPQHTSFAQKMAQASVFRDLFHVHRPILVDDLQGTAHHQYGLMWNMVYILKRGGVVFYKANWTDPNSVRMALAYLFEQHSRMQEGMFMPTFYWEMQGFRENSYERFMAGLHRNGPAAVEQWNRQRSRRGEPPGPAPAPF